MAAGFSIESDEERYVEDKCSGHHGTHLPGNNNNNNNNNSLLEMLVQSFCGILY